MANQNPKAKKQQPELSKKEERLWKAKERVENLAKERLLRNVEITAKNKKKHRREWLETVKKYKVPEMKEEIEIASRTFDRNIDKRDHRIKMLWSQLDEAEEQYRVNERAHAERIDSTLKKYTTIVQERQETFWAKVFNAQNRFNVDANEINSGIQSEEERLDLIATCITDRLEDLFTNNLKSNATNKINSFIDESKNQRGLSASKLEKRLKTLWEELTMILTNYQNETKEHKASYEALYAKDQKDREVANRQNAYLSNLYKDIQWLKGQMTACQLQNEKKIQDMTKERNFFFDSYQSLKTKVQQDEKLEKDRLISLAIEHDHTMEHLRKFLSKAANLSMIVEACEKYRVTEDQQILPFRTVAQMNESPLAVLNSELCMHEQIANDYDLLSGFWQQVGRTYFSIEAMRKERDELRWKNNSLKMNLRQYIRQSNVIG